jgi:hypothetical protein
MRTEKEYRPMENSNKSNRAWAALPALAVTILMLLVAAPRPALAHCDTLNGPVVTDAQKALDSGDLTSVLKWVKTDAEPEIRVAFARTLAVRESGPAARDLADTWFYETLVRVHRAGEGAPYTGLKPAGTNVEPGIEAADHALESGSIEPLVKELTAAIDASVRDRFRLAANAAREKDASVQAGREYVEAYVQFIHYVERLHQEVTGPASVEHHHAEE